MVFAEVVLAEVGSSFNVRRDAAKSAQVGTQGLCPKYTVQIACPKRCVLKSYVK